MDSSDGNQINANKTPLERGDYLNSHRKKKEIKTIRLQSHPTQTI